MLGIRLFSAASIWMWLALGVTGNVATRLHVGLDPSAPAPVSGRLLVFLRPLKSGEPLPDKVDATKQHPRDTTVLAQEVTALAPGAGSDVGERAEAFPGTLSALPPGRYAAQAVLDVGHTYNYAGRGAGDVVGAVKAIDLPAGGTLGLDETIPTLDTWTPRPGASPKAVQAVLAAKPDLHEIDFRSERMTRFWGRPTSLHGWVLVPPGYADAPGRRYPTVYWTHGFGGTPRATLSMAAGVRDGMVRSALPPMIWVFLDQGTPYGTHEFADSANNGPWGTALTEELIPALERVYRMDARPSGRFLTGHSSGGWASLWLQVRYPKLFGGAWPTSPDPGDFHAFSGVDLYAPKANVYRRPDGTPTAWARSKGETLTTWQDVAQLETVVGASGGQMASYEWVFSPRGADGRPKPMFDRRTGQVDHEVVTYWRDHFDIAERLKRERAAIGHNLDGKIHLFVGTDDTFGLDASARALQAEMQALNIPAEFHYLPGKTHFDLYQTPDDPQGLLKQIAWAIYAASGRTPSAHLPADQSVAPPLTG